jgi:hypothetical protein
MQPQRRRPIFRIRENTATSERSSVDKWLVRLSHISQFGLLLFTVGTIYFTVVPLSQKALLEEAIAKKEIELKDATLLLDAKEKLLGSAQDKLAKVNLDLAKTRHDLAHAQLISYIQQRDANLFSLVMRASAECTGLLRPPKNFDLDAKASHKEPFEENFEIAPGDCIQEAFQRSRLKTELKAPDLSHFENEIATLSASLRQRKAAAVKNSNEVSDAARRNPKLLRAPGYFEARMEAFLARARIISPVPPELQLQQEFGRAVTRTRNAISNEYLQAARDSINDLRQTSWPVKVVP